MEKVVMENKKMEQVETEEKRYAIFLGVDGEVKIIDCPKENYLQWGYQQIGCDMVECVRPRGLPEGMVFFTDEEGLLKDSPKLNLMASYFYGTLEHCQPIVGNCIILREVDGPDSYDFDCLSAEDANKWYDYCVGKMKVLPLLFALKFPR